MIQFLSCADGATVSVNPRHTYPADIAQNSYIPGHIGQSSPQLSTLEHQLREYSDPSAVDIGLGYPE
jgi:hypothetical protein